jgi:hypothetical protein
MTETESTAPKRQHIGQILGGSEYNGKTGHTKLLKWIDMQPVARVILEDQTMSLAAPVISV